MPMTSFGTDGFFSSGDTGTYEIAYDMAIDSKGRILIGFLQEDSVGDYWPSLYRLTPAGDPDPTFAVGGQYIESVQNCRGDQTVSVAVDATDRPLIGCTFTFDQGGDPSRPNNDWFIRRLTTAGVADLNKVGAIDLDVPGDNMDDRLEQIEIMADGRLVAVGSAQFSGGDHDMAIIVWEPTALDGFALDTDFSGDGRHTVPFDLGGGKFDAAYRVIQDGANFVLAGIAQIFQGMHMAVARLNATTGDWDTLFSSNGKADYAYLPFGGTASKLNSLEDIVVAPGGGYVLAGLTETTSEKSALARIDWWGTIDVSWGALGWSLADISFPGVLLTEADSRISSLAVDSLGRFVAVGWVEDPTPAPVPPAFGFIARWTSSGQLDSTFTASGVQTLDFQPSGQSAATWFQGLGLTDLATAAVVAGSKKGVTGGVNRADSDSLVVKIHLEKEIFSDGFESGNTTAWQ